MPSSSSKKSVTSVASLSGESWREARDVPPFALRAAAGPVGRDLGALFLGAGSASVLSASAAPASSIDMYNNDVGKKSAQKFMKQTGDLKAATLYFAS
jgi:hypothetical protein